MAILLQEQEPAGPPVKNTFIHFDLAADEGVRGRARALRRNRTDPASPPPPVCREAVPPASDAEEPALIAAGPAGTETAKPPTPPTSPEWGFRSVVLDGLPPPLPPPLRAPGAAAAKPTPIFLVEGIFGREAPAAGSPQVDPPETPREAWRSKGWAPPEWTPEPQQQLRPSGPAPLLPPIVSDSSNTPGSPFMLFEGGGVFFGFTLRRADGISLGLDVACCDGGRTLLVRGVMAGGAVEAWNRQVVGSANAGKAVVPGDKIVRVNACTGDCDGMLAECREKLLVKLLFVRGGLDCELPLAWHDAAALRGSVVAAGGLSRQRCEPAE